MSVLNKIETYLLYNSNNLTNFITAGELNPAQANWLRHYDESVKSMMLILAHEIDELKKKAV